MTLRDKVLARIREDRERCEKATRGPWRITKHISVNEAADIDYPGVEISFHENDSHYHDAAIQVYSDHAEENGELIASARTLLPALLSEAERQVEEHAPRRCNGFVGDVEPHDICAAHDWMVGMHIPMDRCPVVLAWARVFGIGGEE